MNIRAGAGEGFARRGRETGFTLIELMIVAAIIAILAAIAVPNYLEAQARTKVSRVHAELRSIATALGAYHVDHNDFPEGTDDVTKMPQRIVDALGPLASGFYALRSRGPGGAVAGIHFHTLTTPIAYMADMPDDPFAGEGSIRLPYAYRNAKWTHDGYILTSVGPDRDLFAPDGRGNTDANNPLSTAADAKSPARIGDINERAVIHFLEGTGGTTAEQRSQLRRNLDDLTYDPTNGVHSEGDIFRLSGYPR